MVRDAYIGVFNAVQHVAVNGRFAGMQTRGAADAVGATGTAAISANPTAATAVDTHGVRRRFMVPPLTGDEQQLSVNVTRNWLLKVKWLKQHH